MNTSGNMLALLLRYTAIFAAVWLVSHLVLFYYGKSILYWDDCISVYYEVEMFKSQVLWRLLQGGSAWTNFNLYGDYTRSSINGGIYGGDIFDLIWLFVPREHAEAAYVFLTVLRVYVAGLGAVWLLKYRSVTESYIIPGSMIYVMYGFILVNEVIQPAFVTMFLLLPFLLLSMERLIKENKGIPFAVLMGVSFITNVAMAYYLTMGLVFYFLMMAARDGLSLWENLGLLWRVTKYYLLGICLGMPLGLSELIELLNTPRLGTESHAQIVWSLSGFFSQATLSEFAHLFLVGKHYVGVSSLLFFPMAYLAVTKGRKRAYLLFLLLGIILLHMTILKDILGETIATDRWSFLLGIIAALLFAETLPDMLAGYNCLEQKLKKRMYVIMAVYAAAALAFMQPEGWKSMLMLAASLGGSAFLYIRILHQGSESSRSKMIYGILFLSAGISGLYAYTINTKAVSHNADIGTVNARLEEYVNSSAVDILQEDKSFYRVDQSQFTDEMNCNLNFWYGYNGTSAFNGLLNPTAIEYTKVLENTGLTQINKAAAYGGKFTDETLAGVKYFISDSKYKGEKPYGFAAIRETEKGPVYRNAMYVSPILFYKGTLARKAFDQMNIAEKEEVLLKSLVLDTGAEGKLPPLKSREIPCRIVGLKNMAEKDGAYIAKDKGAYLELELGEAEINGELYVELADVTMPGSANPIITVSNGYGFDSANVGGAYYIRKNQQKDFCFLLGSYSSLAEEQRHVRIEVPRGRNMKFSGIRAYSRDLTEAEQDVRQLNQIDVSGVNAEWDHLSAKVKSSEDGYLLFSVPYRPGWKCYIDGVPVETFKGNIMYIGTEIRQGEHEVELRYVAKEFWYGLSLSACAALILAIIALRGRLPIKSKTDN